MNAKTCAYPGCDQPKKELKGTGHQSGFCVAHDREYFRRRYAGDWEGWEAPRRKKETTPRRKQGVTPRVSKRTKREPTPPAVALTPVPTPPMRIIALRCAVCGVKFPYTDEHYNVAGQSRTCRHCAEAQIVTIVDPISSTARRARLLIADEPVSCGDGAEAYAAFARAEKAAGHHVVIEW